VTGPPVLSLAGVRARHPSGFVLEVPSLDVVAGEVLVIIGPNGSGKSTLLRLLALLAVPDAGEVRFHGRPVDARRALAERRRVAIVFQQPLLAAGTAAANVALGLRFRGVPAAEHPARVRRWLERLGVEALADRHTATLSGGEAQRVALARALVLEPEVLLLDEPFAAVDEATRSVLVPDLAAILRADRVTTVLVTHDRGDAQALADRIGVLIGGRLLQLDEVTRVFQAPASEEVARFVGVETIVGGRVVAVDGGLCAVDADGVHLEVAGAAEPGERVRICIRPEDVTVARVSETDPPSSARNRLRGAVVRVTPVAAQLRVHIDCGFPLIATVTRRSAEELGLSAGLRVTATFKANAAHLLRASLDTPARQGL
jgi:molybdopterin-binding protein